MGPGQHCKLPPSAAHRWLVCTPSAFLEKDEPTVYSPYAAEGTEAHELAEIKLSFKTGKMNETEYNTRLNHFKETSKFYNEEFNEYVDKYVTEVLNILNINYKDIETKIFFEERVEFTDIVPDGAGTSDCVIVGPDFIHIIDLKFGKGVTVSAIDNPQLKLYALGAVKKHIRECICREVRMTIIQPRLDSVSYDYMPIESLNYWAMNTVKPKAQLAIAGKGDLVPGEHCRFCKMKAKCQALADKQLALARQEFETVVVDDKILAPQNMSVDTISRILDVGPKFIEWFKDVEKYANIIAIRDGVKIPGYKIVEGRSVRQIINPEAVAEKLNELGFEQKDYLKPVELLGISYLEKNIGKKLFNSVCEQYIVKPQGKPTLVPETDRRTAIDQRTLRLDGSEFDYTIEIEEE